MSPEILKGSPYDTQVLIIIKGTLYDKQILIIINGTLSVAGSSIYKRNSL